MPELPEIEAVRRRLETRLRGFEIRRVELRSTQLRMPIPSDIATVLRGARIEAIRRQGKYLLFDLNNGKTWIVHLGMSGRLLVGDASVRDAHDHLVLTGSCGTVLRYNDFRRFGRLEVCATRALPQQPLLARLGIDVLAPELDSERLHSLLAKRRTTIKCALLNQQLIAGVGNIYACEALYWANLSPYRLANSIDRIEADRLIVSLRTTLGLAIAAGGATLRDYRGTSGEMGNFQNSFAVFGRNGCRCPRCQRVPCVRLDRLGGRATYWCPTQQT